jgi:acyl-CoA thioesterase FadM
VIELAQTVCGEAGVLVTALVRVVCVNTLTFRPVRIPTLIVEKLAVRCA